MPNQIPTIVFISGYEQVENSQQVIRVLDSGRSISHFEYFKVDRWLVKEALRWCTKNGFQLLVAGRSTIANGEECAWFEEILGSQGSNWQFRPREDLWSSYRLVDSALLTVNSDSTLGYESLARGNKTVFFSSRGSELESESSNFGWPAHNEQDGPFWTTSRDHGIFNSLANYVLTLTEDEWENLVNMEISNVLATNQGNTKIKRIVKKILEGYSAC